MARTIGITDTGWSMSGLMEAGEARRITTIFMRETYLFIQANRNLVLIHDIRLDMYSIISTRSIGKISRQSSTNPLQLDPLETYLS